MKAMDFDSGQGANRSHSRSYGEDEQRRHGTKDAFSCSDIYAADHQARPGQDRGARPAAYSRRVPFSADAMPPSRKPSSPVRDRLAQAGVRMTPAREAVLDILLSAPQAMSHLEVEQAARERGLEADRVTLYRVLDWLVNQGIAHKIEGRDRVWRFNAVAAGDHGHAHFHCTRCGRVFCLEQPRPRLTPRLPPGFRFEKVEVTFEGVCAECAEG